MTRRGCAFRGSQRRITLAVMRCVLASFLAVSSGACDRLQQLAAGDEPPSTSDRPPEPSFEAAASPTPGAGPASFGAFAQSGPLDVRVLTVEDPFVATGGPMSEALRTGKTRYVAVEVELVHSRGQEPQKYSYGKFHLYDRRGRAFESHYADASVRAPHLVEGYLLPGKKAVGWVTFEVPTDAELDYVQFFLGYLEGEPVGLTLRRSE